MIPVFSPTLIAMRSSGYTGPGDISAALGWWGLRAYSAASIGTNAVRLRESGGNTEQDFATVVGGGLDLAAIATFKGANNLFVVKLYDQTGGGNDLIQATAGSQPLFLLAAIGSLPAIDNTATASVRLETTSNITQAQPLTFSTVYNRTSTAVDGILFANNGAIQAVRTAVVGANLSGIFAGTSLTAAANDVAWHAVQMLINGVSSQIYIDGSGTTGNAGTGAFLAEKLALLGLAGGGFPFTGYVGELGMWGSDISANFSALNTNQHTYWGF